MYIFFWKKIMNSKTHMAKSYRNHAFLNNHFQMKNKTTFNYYTFKMTTYNLAKKKRLLIIKWGWQLSWTKQLTLCKKAFHNNSFFPYKCDYKSVLLNKREKKITWANSATTQNSRAFQKESSISIIFPCLSFRNIWNHTNQFFYGDATNVKQWRHRSI